MAESLERAERLAKILSLVLIPVVLGIGGWMVNAALQQQNVNHQYVQLALEILRTDEGDIDPQLRLWAADLLSDRAPVTMHKDLVERLGRGQVALPDQRRGAEALVIASKEYVRALDIGVRRTLERVTPRELHRLRNLSTRAGYAGPGALEQWMGESKRRALVYRLLVRDAELMRRFFLALKAATPREGAASVTVADVDALLTDLQKLYGELGKALTQSQPAVAEVPAWLASLPESQQAVGRNLLTHLALHAATIEDLRRSFDEVNSVFIEPIEPDPRQKLLGEVQEAAKGLRSYNNMRHVLTPLDLASDWNERALAWLIEEYRGDVETELFRAMGDMVALMRLQLLAFLRGRSSPAIAVALADSAEKVRELTVRD